MKRYIFRQWLLIAAICLSSHSLAAYFDGCGGIDLIGEYLYIRPHLCELNFVIRDDRQANDPQFTIVPNSSDLFIPDGRLVANNPDYESAFRVGLGYTFNCGCNDITVTYTRLETRDSKTVTADGSGGLWITDGHPRYTSLRLNNIALVEPITLPFLMPPIDALAQSRVRVEYNMIDGVAAARGWQGCHLWYRAFVGLRWADIEVSHDATYRGLVTVVSTVVEVPAPPVPPSLPEMALRAYFNQFTELHQRADAWGIGPRAGLDFDYDLFCGFGIGAHLGVSLLLGESCLRMDEADRRVSISSIVPNSFVDPTPVNEETQVHKSSHGPLFPQWDARLGLNYLYCCGSCFALSIEVGWEFVSYINAISRYRFNDEGGTGRDVCESFNIDGLYVAFRLSV